MYESADLVRQKRPPALDLIACTGTRMLSVIASALRGAKVRF